MKTSLKTGVIGLGARGSQLLETIVSCEESDVIALCDLYEDRREKNRKMVERCKSLCYFCRNIAQLKLLCIV